MLCSIFQRYKSKAIHNTTGTNESCFCAVFNISKIQIESNSQQGVGVGFQGRCCVQYFKDTNRKQFTTSLKHLITFRRLCSIFQRYKSKAIHNSAAVWPKLFFAVFNISKIQIESNSQHKQSIAFLEISCVQYFKDTNRKQFTTAIEKAAREALLCSIFQRYKSKAIHNR